jgi:hypothetical protein
LRFANGKPYFIELFAIREISNKLCATEFLININFESELLILANHNLEKLIQFAQKSRVIK